MPSSENIAGQEEPTAVEDSGAPPNDDNGAAKKKSKGPGNQKQILTIVLILLLWTWLYNICIKEQGLFQSFFQVLDTISDDFVMGSAYTIIVGLLVVVIFSITKLYGQIVANRHSFKMLEDIWYDDVCQGKLRLVVVKLLNFGELPQPKQVCPRHASAILFSFSLIYFMSWVYLLLFSEALHFVSWSAGVRLPINEGNLIFLPALALAVPFSARVMAYIRYPYAQDYADFMPGAAFVFLVVAALGVLFESSDQKFIMIEIYEKKLLAAFLRNGVFLAFIPVFFEAMFWLFELNRRSVESEDAKAET